MSIQLSQLEVLSTLLNTTFGASSSKFGTRSITASFSDGLLILKYQTITQFAANGSAYAHTLASQVNLLVDESAQLIDEKIAQLKRQYKDITGKSLKIKSLSTSDSIELLPSTVHSPRKSAYFRKIFKFELKD